MRECAYCCSDNATELIWHDQLQAWVHEACLRRLEEPLPRILEGPRYQIHNMLLSAMI